MAKSKKDSVHVKASASESIKAGLFGSLGVALGGTVGIIIVIAVLLVLCVGCCFFTGMLGAFTDTTYQTTSQ